MQVVGTLQPVCSLRLQQIKFRQAPAVWGQRHSILLKQQPPITQARQQASHKRHPERSVACSDAAVPHIPFPGDNQSSAFFAALSQDEEDITSNTESTAEDLATPQSNNGGPPDKPEPRIPHRWRIIGMMALAFVLCNMDKVLHTCGTGIAASCRFQSHVLAVSEDCTLQVNMSVAVIPMAEELGWSATDRGLVSSAFFWGYALTQIPAGYISTKYGKLMPKVAWGHQHV